MTELSPKEELEQLEMSLMSLVHGFKGKIEEAKDPIYEYWAVDGETLEKIVAGLEAATGSMGGIASQLHVLDELTSSEFELILLSLDDVREHALEEVMASDKDMSPVDFVDGIIAKLRKDED